MTEIKPSPKIQWAMQEADRLRGVVESGAQGGQRNVAGMRPLKVRYRATAALEFLRQHGGEYSDFYKNAAAVFFNESPMDGGLALLAVGEILEQWALYEVSEMASLPSYEVRSRQDAATDLMEQVQSLLDDRKMHDAPPVMLAGAALEEFLRSLVAANSCSIIGKPGINTYAQALKAAGAISAQDLKDITSWAGQRNEAAHGLFEDLSRARTQVMVDGINLFMRKYAP